MVRVVSLPIPADALPGPPAAGPIVCGLVCPLLRQSPGARVVPWASGLSCPEVHPLLLEACHELLAEARRCVNRPQSGEEP